MSLEIQECDQSHEVKLVKSVARTIDLLVLFVNTDKYLSLKDIAELLNLPKSSAFELVKTLVYKGILEVKDQNKKTYGLSLLAFEIGSCAISDTGVHDIARPYIQGLNRITGGTVFLGVEDHGKIVYIDRAEDHSIFKAQAKLGSRRNLHTTSLGKAILYAHSDDKILSLLGDEPYPVNTPLSKTTSVEILKDAKETRVRKYAIDDREDGVNMYCMGTVIRDRFNNPIASISVASFYDSMTESKKQMIAVKLVETALEISRKLGFSGESLY